jgi:hypothetical protein
MNVRTNEGTIEDRSPEPWHISRGVSVAQIITISTLAVMGIVAWVNLTRDVEAGQEEQKKISQTTKENKEDIQDIKINVAVIKERQKVVQELLRDILKEVKK